MSSFTLTATVGLATTSLPPENLEVDCVLNEDDVDAMYDGTFVSTESAELPSLNDNISTTDSLSLQQEEHDDELTLHLDQSIGNNDWYAGDCWVCSKELEAFLVIPARKLFILNVQQRAIAIGAVW